MKYDTLCFSGGGVRGLSFAQCLLSIKEYSIAEPESCVHLVGTSIGALFSFVLSIGYTCEEIYTKIWLSSFSELFKPSLLNIFFQWSIDDAKLIKKMLQELLDSKWQKKDLGACTFRSIYQENGKKLNVVATNITDNKPAVFSVENTPDMCAVDAVFCSMCLPFLFPPVKIGNKIYVDGGLCCNFPYEYCGSNTLHLQVTWNDSVRINRIDDYISRIIYCGLSKGNPPEQVMKNTIKINVDCSTINFTITPTQKAKILEQGKRAVELFMKKKKGESGNL